MKVLKIKVCETTKRVMGKVKHRQVGLTFLKKFKPYFLQILGNHNKTRDFKNVKQKEN